MFSIMGALGDSKHELTPWNAWSCVHFPLEVWGLGVVKLVIYDSHYRLTKAIYESLQLATYLQSDGRPYRSLVLCPVCPDTPC
jgi:hypothetical protein